MPSDGPDERNETLRRLAEVLDVSPRTFSEPTVSPEDFSEPTIGNLPETIELLRLWSGITDGQDRAKVIAFVRTVASRA